MNASTTRRKFLKVTAAGAAAVAMLSPLAVFSAAPKEERKQFVRIKPVPGETYSPSFMRLCNRARFASVKDALARVKNRRISFVISSS